jgi:hypothetical protein
LDFKCKLQSRIGFPDIFTGSGQGPSFFDTFCRRTEATFDKTSFVTIFDDVCNDNEDDFEFQSTLRKELYLLRKGELVLLELLINEIYLKKSYFVSFVIKGMLDFDLEQTFNFF